MIAKFSSFFINLFLSFQTLYIKLKYRRDEKKLNAEIPKLIDCLIAYLNAGLHPCQALELSSQKVFFSKTLRFPLFKITTLFARGCSFVDAIDIVLNDVLLMPSRKYLVLLLIGLKISFLKGSGSIRIIEKIRQKANDEIEFQRKLKVITAQMRLQAYVILLSPLILGSLLFLIAPDHILIFFQNAAGNFLLIFMIFLNLCGYFALNKLMNIE